MRRTVLPGDGLLPAEGTALQRSHRLLYQGRHRQARHPVDTAPHSPVLPHAGRVRQRTGILPDGRGACPREHITAVADRRKLRHNETVRRGLRTLLQGRVPQARLTARHTRHRLVLIHHRQGPASTRILQTPARNANSKLPGLPQRRPCRVGQPQQRPSHRVLPESKGTLRQRRQSRPANHARQRDINFSRRKRERTAAVKGFDIVNLYCSPVLGKLSIGLRGIATPPVKCHPGRVRLRNLKNCPSFKEGRAKRWEMF